MIDIDENHVPFVWNAFVAGTKIWISSRTVIKKKSKITNYKIIIKSKYNKQISNKQQST